MSIGDPPDANGTGHVDAILRAVAGQRVAAIMCTHTHRDHSPAAAPLKEATGAPIVGCAPLVIDSGVLNEWGPRSDESFDPDYAQIGRAHVRTPVTNAHLVCRLLLEKNKQ